MLISSSSSPVIPSPLSPAVATLALSSSVGKKRKPTSSAIARRRLSQSSTGLRPQQGIAISHSMPMVRGGGTLAELGPGDDGEDDGEIKGKDAKKAGGVFECEKCRKVCSLSSHPSSCHPSLSHQLVIPPALLTRVLIFYILFLLTTTPSTFVCVYRCIDILLV